MVHKNLVRRMDDLISACQALDIRYLDTAQYYAGGFAGLLVRLGTLRHSAWRPRIATKVGYGISPNPGDVSSSAPQRAVFMSGRDKVNEKIRRQSRQAAMTLGSTNIDTLLLHNPPQWFAGRESTWAQLSEKRVELGIRKIGLSSDRLLELDDIPKNLPEVVVQISASQFVERNDFLFDIAEYTNLEVVVNSVMGLGPNIGHNLDLLAHQKIRPNVALYGTTRASRLHLAAEHLHSLNGKAS